MKTKFEKRVLRQVYFEENVEIFSVIIIDSVHKWMPYNKTEMEIK